MAEQVYTQSEVEEFFAEAEKFSVAVPGDVQALWCYAYLKGRFGIGGK